MYVFASLALVSKNSTLGFDVWHQIQLSKKICGSVSGPSKKEYEEAMLEYGWEIHHLSMVSNSGKMLYRTLFVASYEFFVTLEFYTLLKSHGLRFMESKKITSLSSCAVDVPPGSPSIAIHSNQGNKDIWYQKSSPCRIMCARGLLPSAQNPPSTLTWVHCGMQKQNIDPVDPMAVVLVQCPNFTLPHIWEVITKRNPP